jgi:hypothetical protein
MVTPEDARKQLQADFDAHTCKRLDESQDSARVVREQKLSLRKRLFKVPERYAEIATIGVSGDTSEARASCIGILVFPGNRLPR